MLGADNVTHEPSEGTKLTNNKDDQPKLGSPEPTTLEDAVPIQRVAVDYETPRLTALPISPFEEAETQPLSSNSVHPLGYLEISVTHTEFAKAFAYFVTVQMDQEDKRRTEVSTVSTQPTFSSNTFLWPLRADFNLAARIIHFACFVVIERESIDSQSSEALSHRSKEPISLTSHARLLGTVEFPLKDIIQKLELLAPNEPLHETLTFWRKTKESPILVPVGRFGVAVSRKMHVTSTSGSADTFSASQTPISTDRFLDHAMFPTEPLASRLRVWVRSAVDLPLDASASGTPTGGGGRTSSGGGGRTSSGGGVESGQLDLPISWVAVRKLKLIKSWKTHNSSMDHLDLHTDFEEDTDIGVVKTAAAGPDRHPIWQQELIHPIKHGNLQRSHDDDDELLTEEEEKTTVWSIELVLQGAGSENHIMGSVRILNGWLKPFEPVHLELTFPQRSKSRLVNGSSDHIKLDSTRLYLSICYEPSVSRLRKVPGGDLLELGIDGLNDVHTLNQDVSQVMMMVHTKPAKLNSQMKLSVPLVHIDSTNRLGIKDSILKYFSMSLERLLTVPLSEDTSTVETDMKDSNNNSNGDKHLYLTCSVSLSRASKLTVRGFIRLPLDVLNHLSNPLLFVSLFQLDGRSNTSIPLPLTYNGSAVVPTHLCHGILENASSDRFELALQSLSPSTTLTVKMYAKKWRTLCPFPQQQAAQGTPHPHETADQSKSKTPADDREGLTVQWSVLSEELKQKNQLVNRIIKDLDVKADALKRAGLEIVDLRRQVKLLQSENVLLRKRLRDEEDAEQVILESVNESSLSYNKLSKEELFKRIQLLGQKYRLEMEKVSELQTVLQQSRIELRDMQGHARQYEKLQQAHMSQAVVLQKMQEEISKLELYKTTARKQEKVIAKLESIMEQTVKEQHKNRQIQLEYERLKTQNLTLQEKLKQGLGNGAGGSEEMVRKQLKEKQKEIDRLEAVVEEMRARKMEFGGGHGDDDGEGGEEWQQEKLQLIMRAEKSEQRAMSLQAEMTENARKFAKEISSLRLQIAEKESQIMELAGASSGDFDVNEEYI